MAKRIKDILNGDLTDLLNLNILLYTYTYVLSIIFSILYHVVTLESQPFNWNEFLKVLTDCIVPTTSTLVLSNLVQNFISASQKGITRCALSFWTLMAVTAYMTLYPALRRYFDFYFFIVVLFISAVIVVLGMYSIVQIDKGPNNKTRSLSG